MEKEGQAVSFCSSRLGDQAAYKKDDPGEDESKQEAVEIEKGGLGHKDHGAAAFKNKEDVQSRSNHGGADSPESRGPFPEIGPEQRKQCDRDHAEGHNGQLGYRSGRIPGDDDGYDQYGQHTDPGHGDLLSLQHTGPD